MVLRMARENTSCGYDRIQGALANLGYIVAPNTVKNILIRHGIEPAPERGKRTSWETFLRAHWDVGAATDFFTVEVWTPRGLITYYVLLIIHLSARFVHVSHHESRYKYTEAFRGYLHREGVKPVRCPVRAPNCHAFAERFVRSIKSECLDRMILFGKASLRRALREYLAHYHTERNHQGVGNRLRESPAIGSSANEPIQRRKRLGRMLNFHYREAA
jgi:putative transposase